MSGERIGTLGIATDITHLKALERQLNKNNLELQQQTHLAEEANRAKSDFLAAMSHEIRTPMNAILGMADLLWESELNPTQKQYVEVFRRAAANLLTLVNDILDLSKIESGRFELECIDFDLEDLVERTVELVRPKTRAKHIDLISRIKPGTPCGLVGDPTRLQQVLLNLLGNAVKFTEHGQIVLTVTPGFSAPNRIRFEVCDTGIGIANDKLESIFCDFTQAESSTTRRFGGTGLGLGIARRLVALMGGQLMVASELGKGSTFSFEATFGLSVQARVRRLEQVTDLVGRHVLVVDNNPTNRLIFAEMCTSWGMIAWECASADTALTTLQESGADHKFDLTILDRLMPGMDGFTFVTTLRDKQIIVPVLMTTSDNVPGDETKSKHLGIAGYAVKPVRRSELLRLICKALDTGAGESAPDKIIPQRQDSIVGTVYPSSTSFKGRILIAEDSEDNRFVLQAYLKDTPHFVTFVENGKLAFEIFQSQPFDLILMDMHMPVMDGLAATRAIRETELKLGREPVPILALTANARAEDTQSSSDAGCDSHLSKPISKSKLLSTISKYIRETQTSVAPDPVAIELPEGLEEAARVYIHSRQKEVPQLVQLAEARDFEQLRTLAHNMKGIGASFGFPELTRFGEVIELSAKQHDTSALSEQLLELSRYVDDAAEAVSKIPS